MTVEELIDKSLLKRTLLEHNILFQSPYYTITVSWDGFLLLKPLGTDIIEEGSFTNQDWRGGWYFGLYEWEGQSYYVLGQRVKRRGDRYRGYRDHWVSISFWRKG